MKSPRVSVGMPVYNGERYIARAIESILCQTLTDFELVISDNASTDATEQICRQYAARDSRVRYFRTSRNIGANANFNRVVALSNYATQYFRWAAHDDLCAPTHLECCVRALDEDPSAVLSYPLTALIDAEGESLSPQEAVEQGLPLRPDPRRHLDSPYPQRRFAGILLRTRWCFEIFGVIRRSALAQTGMQQNYYGTDKVILATLALLGPFREVPEELFLRRCHRTQSTNIRSGADRAVWSNPNVRRPPLIVQFPCLRGYIRAMHSVKMFSAEKLACSLAIGRYLLQGRKIISHLRDELHFLLGSSNRQLPRNIRVAAPDPGLTAAIPAPSVSLWRDGRLVPREPLVPGSKPRRLKAGAMERNYN